MVERKHCYYTHAYIATHLWVPRGRAAPPGRAPPAPAARLPPEPPILSKDSDSEDVSDAEPVRVEDGDDDEDARSLESDEAEETESDGAVLAASSRGGDGASGTGKGALQDGFGKYT